MMRRLWHAWRGFWWAFGPAIALLTVIAANDQPARSQGTMSGYSAEGLDFDFQNGRYWQGGASMSSTVANFVTTSRASTGYADDTSGNWTLFSNNVARVTNKGLLVEESRTNSIRNNSMQGAVAGTPGTLPTNWAFENADGLSQQVVGTGTVNGVDYIDIQMSGTTSGTALSLRFDGQTQVAASSGQAWSFAPFVQVLTDDANVTDAIVEILSLNSTPSEISRTTTSFYSSRLVWGRQSNTTASTPASTASVNARLRFVTNASASVTLKFRIGWPDLELGAFATSPIRTTSAAVTRAADVVTVTQVPTFSGTFSIFASVGTPEAPSSYSNGQEIFTVDAGGSTSRVDLARQNGTGTWKLRGATGGVNYINNTFGSAFSADSKAAARLAPSDQAAFNTAGGSVTNTTGTPVVPTRIYIGNDSGGGFQADNYIKRIALWPTTGLPNSALQQLTIAANDNHDPEATMLAAGYGYGDVPRKKVRR